LRERHNFVFPSGTTLRYGRVWATVLYYRIIAHILGIHSSKFITTTPFQGLACGIVPKKRKRTHSMMLPWTHQGLQACSVTRTIRRAHNSDRKRSSSRRQTFRRSLDHQFMPRLVSTQTHRKIHLPSTTSYFQIVEMTHPSTTLFSVSMSRALRQRPTMSNWRTMRTPLSLTSETS
jgi:hypothetical protein